MADIVIRGGTIIDGTGAAPYEADVAIAGDRILQVGGDIGPGREEIDATGMIVTPGFVDVHTHYDGQATWSDRMSPSSGHGVTTVVTGNCGVGFAPCRPADHEALINVMQGVEDIPEAVMSEGVPWTWETFPQYLDALAERSWDVDVAAYIPHSPLRVYAMGDRGLDREPATEADLARMSELVEEAMAAGAMGFATSRTLSHRTADGKFIPSFDADRAELEAMAQAVGRSGRGVIQMIPHYRQSEWRDELEGIVRLGEISGRPVTFTLAQSHGDRENEDKMMWRKILDGVAEANTNRGTRLMPQVFPRPMGIISGLSASTNPFTSFPSYAAIAALPFEERLAAMRDSGFRERLLSEEPDPDDHLYRLTTNFERMYPMARQPSYEPSAEDSIAGRARRHGVTPLEELYDVLIEDDGRALILLPFTNYAHQNLDAALEMMRDPNTIVGLGDGGAHYGLICDASYPTTMLAYWARDREGERLPLTAVVKELTADTADLMGLSDRGRIAPGLKADINVIDHARLTLHRPHIVADLPSGGRRLTQDADGYRATILSGRVTRRDGKPTDERPGRLVRGGSQTLH